MRPHDGRSGSLLAGGRTISAAYGRSCPARVGDRDRFSKTASASLAHRMMVLEIRFD